MKNRDECALRVHFANRDGGAAGIDQIVDDDKAFAVAFLHVSALQFALVIVIVAGDAYGNYTAPTTRQ